MNEFKICDICNAEYVDELAEKLKELDKAADISIGCQSMCALGNSGKVFVIVNGITCDDDSIDGVIEKVKEKMK